MSKEVFNKLRDYSIHSLLMPALFVVVCLFTAPVVGAQTQDAKTEVIQAKAVKGGEAAIRLVRPRRVITGSLCLKPVPEP